LPYMKRPPKLFTKIVKHAPHAVSYIGKCWIPWGNKYIRVKHNYDVCNNEKRYSGSRTQRISLHRRAATKSDVRI
jgi:hypothetical protein